MLDDWLSKLLKVLPTGSEIEIERALKWVLCIQQLLFRLDHGTRKGRCLHTAILRKHFELFEEGSLRILMGLWRPDVAAAFARPGRRS